MGVSWLIKLIACISGLLQIALFIGKGRKFLRNKSSNSMQFCDFQSVTKNWVKGISIYRHIIRKHYCIQTYLLLCHKNSDWRPLHSKNYATVCSELMILSPLKQLLWRCQVYGKSQQAGFSKIDWKWLPRGRACNAWTSVYFTSKDQRW